jgi:hypothetical protein
MSPVSRRDGVLTHEVDGELVVYDQENDTAHRLNPVAAKVWQNCDGQRSVADLAELLGSDAAPDGAAVVKQALGELDRANLLEGGGAATLTRRTAMRRMAQVAGVVMVTSIVAPTPAAALSGGGNPGKAPKGPKGPTPGIPKGPPPNKGKKPK